MLTFFILKTCYWILFSNFKLSVLCSVLPVCHHGNKEIRIAWGLGDPLGSAFSQGRFLQWFLPCTVPTALLIFLRVSSLCASCPSVLPHPHGAALWPWLCGDFTKTFLQLVEGGGHMGWSSEEIGVGFLFSP